MTASDLLSRLGVVYAGGAPGRRVHVDGDRGGRNVFDAELAKPEGLRCSGYTTAAPDA